MNSQMHLLFIIILKMLVGKLNKLKEEVKITVNSLLLHPFKGALKSVPLLS